MVEYVPLDLECPVCGPVCRIVVYPRSGFAGCDRCKNIWTADHFPRVGGGANADNWRRLFAWLKDRPVNARKGGV